MNADHLDLSDAAVTRLLEGLDADTGVSNAFTEVLHDRTLAEAEQTRSEGPRGDRPLHGVAVGIKELFDVAGADNSYGSQTRRGHRSDRDAEIVSRLRAAGALIVGTTRSHEFGWGITTQRVGGPSTLNPWNTSLIPGGSSGGSAAAVARSLVPLAVASDTGGSIRIPASFCGVMGLKTTWGSLTRRGGVSLAPSFDSPGFVARSADLLRRGFNACRGPDPGDAITTVSPPQRIGSHTGTIDWHRTAPGDPPSLSGLRVGLDLAQANLAHSAARRQALIGLVDELRAAGAIVIDIDGPDPAAMYEAFVPYQMAEAFDVHHRILRTYPSRAADYGGDVRARLETAAQVDLGDYLAARRAAIGFAAHHHRLFATVDVIVRIISTTPPSSIESPDHVTVEGQSVALRDAVMPTTVAENLTGLPSVTFPFGSDDGVPIGMQLTGPAHSEPVLLDMLDELERIGIAAVPTPPSSVR